MKLLRHFRQYDSMKAAVLLTAAALLLAGACIRSAAAYAAILKMPAEYVCTAYNGIEAVLPQLTNAEHIRAFSRQKTASLTQKEQTLPVTQLSAAYLSDCFALEGDAHTVWMNAEAFTVFGNPAIQDTVDFYGELDGQPFRARLICTNILPQDEPLAVLAAGAAELRGAETVRICAADQDAFAPERFGLTVVNPEKLCAAGYEREMVLLRIRFGALSAFLALLGAAAFFRLYRNAVMDERSGLCTEETDIPVPDPGTTA